MLRTLSTQGHLHITPSLPTLSHPYAGGADADGCDYAAALGQKLVLCLGQAADDAAAVFGGAAAKGAISSSPGVAGGGGGGQLLDSPDLAAAYLVWALHETER